MHIIEKCDNETLYTFLCSVCFQTVFQYICFLKVVCIKLFIDILL